MGHSEIAAATPTIVVVDDDPAVRSSLEFSLGIDGYLVRTYSSGKELLSGSGLATGRGCMVIDFRLPGMNGLEVLAELRRRGVDLPAILITTHPVDDVRDRAKAMGAVIVEKPLIEGILFDEIRAACR